MLRFHFRFPRSYLLLVPHKLEEWLTVEDKFHLYPENSSHFLGALVYDDKGNALVSCTAGYISVRFREWAEENCIPYEPIGEEGS